MGKIAYVAMSADLVHPGHINIIQEAVKYFAVTKFKKSLLKDFRLYMMKNK